MRKTKFSVYFVHVFFCLLCYTGFGASLLLAQTPDANYEQRAQEVMAGLIRLNGLMGWEATVPATWPQASFDLDGTGAAGLSQDIGVSFSRESPARLTGIRFASLGLGRAADFSGLGALLSLELPGNSFSALNLAGDTALLRISAMKNQLTRLDIGHLPELRWLTLSSNRLESLDISGNSQLLELAVSMNRLTQLDVSQNPALTVLEAGNNQLSAVSVDGNPQLTRLLLSYNQLEELSVNRNPALYELAARDNHLTRLDLSANTQLRELSLSRNSLSDLDLSRNTRLESLMLDENSIHILDLSANPELANLQLKGNPLVELRLGPNPLGRLMTLNVDGCRLPLSRLYPLSGLAQNRGRLGSQEKVLFEETSIEFKDGGATLDLSSEAEFSGEATEFLALTDKKRRLRPSEYRVENGRITFSKPGRYMVMMSNPKIFSSDINQLTGRVHAIKTKVYTGVINVAAVPEALGD